MNLENLRAEIEKEQSWRIDEIRFFQNQTKHLDELSKEKFRRALILILYSHFEGFCKFAFTFYLNAINSAKIKCCEANSAIAAASLSDLFTALRHPEKKSPIFNRILPEDRNLHRFARDIDFVENSHNFQERTVQISDNFIDTESNLKPEILKKLLFKLGFDHNKFENLEGLVHQLLAFRNKIAHGESNSGIKESKYEELKNATLKIMEETKMTIIEAINNRKYLK